MKAEQRQVASDIMASFKKNLFSFVDFETALNEVVEIVASREALAAAKIVRAVEEAGMKRIDEQRERIENAKTPEIKDNQDYFLGGMTEVRDIKDRAAHSAYESLTGEKLV